MQQLNAGSLVVDVILQRRQPCLHGGRGCFLPVQLLLQTPHLAILGPQCCLELLELNCALIRVIRSPRATMTPCMISMPSCSFISSARDAAKRSSSTAMCDCSAVMLASAAARSPSASSCSFSSSWWTAPSSACPLASRSTCSEAPVFKLRLAVSDVQLQALLGSLRSNPKTCCKRLAASHRVALLRREGGFRCGQPGLQLPNDAGTPAPAPTPATPPPGLTVLKPPCSSRPPRPGGAAPPAADAEIAATSESLSHPLGKQALGCRHAMPAALSTLAAIGNHLQCKRRSLGHEPRTHVCLQLLLPLGSGVLPALRLYLSSAQSHPCLPCLLLQSVVLACCRGGRRVELIQLVLPPSQGAEHLLGFLSSVLEGSMFLMKLLRQSRQRGLRDIELLAASLLCSLQGCLQTCNGCSAAVELLHGRLQGVLGVALLALCGCLSHLQVRDEGLARAELGRKCRGACSEIISGQLQRRLSTIARVPLRRRQCCLQVRHDGLARAQVRLQVHDKGLACNKLGCQPSIAVVERRDLALQLPLATGCLLELHGLRAQTVLLGSEHHFFRQASSLRLSIMVLLALDLSLHGLQARRHLLRLLLKSICPASGSRGGRPHLDKFTVTVNQRAAHPLSLYHKLVEHHVLLLQPVCQCRRPGLGVVELLVMSPVGGLQSCLQLCCRSGGAAGMVCRGHMQKCLGVAHGLLRNRQTRLACAELGCGGFHRGLGVATRHLLGYLKRCPGLVALLQPLQRCRHLGGSCLLASLEVATCNATGRFQSLAKVRCLLLVGVELRCALLQRARAAGKLPLSVGQLLPQQDGGNLLLAGGDLELLGDGILSGAEGRAELC
eukprot:SM000042S15311  [mRNA]  locus=s42:243570:247021:- [translate_table: standard]